MGTRKKARQGKSKKRKVLPKAATQNHLQFQHEAIALKITEERHKALIDKLTDSPAVDGFLQFYKLMEESYAMFDTKLDELALEPPLACKMGCIYCCINQVSLSEPEALYLGFHLIKTRNSEQLLDLKKKTLTLLTNLKGKSRHVIGMERHLHPCLFMEDGNCSIYPARPLVCRGWNSVNSEMCKHSNQAGDALAPIENHPLQRILAESIQLGLLNGAREIGLETGYLLLPRAVHLLLEGGVKTIDEQTKNWLEGRVFFATESRHA